VPLAARKEVGMLHKKLKLLLMDRREPQYAVAVRVGLSESQFSRIVRGRRAATSDERARIADVLGVPEGEIFSPAA
jgi:transcriptional regulator with XRE-family HTH domain